MQSKADNFRELIAGDTPVLVDFSAEWCGPCKMMPPILQEVKRNAGDKIRIVKIDIDKSPNTAASYQIQSVPTLLLFKNGQIKWRQSGVIPAAQIQKAISQNA